MQVEFEGRVDELAIASRIGEPGQPGPLDGARVDVTYDAPPDGPRRTVPLVTLAWARSGDKGDDENIGVIAREARFLPLLREQLTSDRVRHWFLHLVQGQVERHEVPGLNALNFVMHQALGGGGVCSLRSDPLGKSYAQILLDFPIEVPAEWLPAA